jgi:hypothetical protein
MALETLCPEGHRYIIPDRYVGEWPKGAPHCPTCYEEWLQTQPAAVVGRGRSRIPKGYHLRTDGAGQLTSNRNAPMTCDVCGNLCMSRVGFERKYPEDPNLYVCGSCAEDWELRVGNDPQVHG